MKIIKEKLPGDIQGAFYMTEEGEKIDEGMATRYAYLMKILGNKKVIAKDFLIS